MQERPLATQRFETLNAFPRGDSLPDLVQRHGSGGHGTAAVAPGRFAQEVVGLSAPTTDEECGEGRPDT